nr:Chain J, 30S ribosomal protein S10 [Aquifex aeolicus]3R2C_K Chain K, 30S ribosomal protein S10 [Aquifex aeolicus]
MEQEKIRIKLRAYDHRLLDQSVKQIIETVKRTGGVVKGPIPLPTRKSEFSRILDIIRFTPQTIEALMEISLPAGVDVEVKMRG